MDIASERSKAHALIDALPQDSLEIVIALMRKLTGFTPQTIQANSDLVLSESQIASLNRVRELAGCFSICQSKDWKVEKAECLQEKYHQ